MVVRGDRMQSIPFQIAEMDEKGWVFLPEVSPNPVRGRYGIIDPVDEIVFMYRDTGYDPYETKRHGAIAGRILQELRFEYGGRARYAYLVQGDPRRNGADYVSFDAETGISRNRYDAFRTDPANFLDFQDFCANGGRVRTSACSTPSMVSWRPACSHPGRSCGSTPWTTSARN